MNAWSGVHEVADDPYVTAQIWLSKATAETKRNLLSYCGAAGA
jgi:hypothetical protein